MSNELTQKQIEFVLKHILLTEDREGYACIVDVSTSIFGDALGNVGGDLK